MFGLPPSEAERSALSSVRPAFRELAPPLQPPARGRSWKDAIGDRDAGAMAQAEAPGDTSMHEPGAAARPEPEPPEKRTVDRVVAVLQSRPGEWISAKELAAISGCENKAVTSTLLARIGRGEVLYRPGVRGNRAAPARFCWPAPAPSPAVGVAARIERAQEHARRARAAAKVFAYLPAVRDWLEELARDLEAHDAAFRAERSA